MFLGKVLLPAALNLALPIKKMAPMYGNSSKLVRLIPNMEQQRQIGEAYTTKWDTQSGYPTRL
jgi:hypothetical protein